MGLVASREHHIYLRSTLEVGPFTTRYMRTASFIKHSLSISEVDPSSTQNEAGVSQKNIVYYLVINIYKQENEYIARGNLNSDISQLLSPCHH